MPLFNFFSRYRKKANLNRIKKELALFLEGVQDNTELYERCIDFKTALEIYEETIK